MSECTDQRRARRGRMLVIGGIVLLALMRQRRRAWLEAADGGPCKGGESGRRFGGHAAPQFGRFGHRFTQSSAAAEPTEA